jgi:septation ring formation regulator EzrA
LLYANEDLSYEERVQKMYQLLIEKTNDRADVEMENVKVKRVYTEMTREKENLQNEINKVQTINSKYQTLCRDL